MFKNNMTNSWTVSSLADSLYQNESLGNWEKIDGQFSDSLKQSVINALSEPQFASKLKPLSLVLATVAKVELPMGRFQECFTFFQQMALNQENR